MSSSLRVLKSYAVFNAVIANTTQYSEVTDVSGLMQVEYDLSWSAGSSLSGTITVEVLISRPTDSPSTWIWQTLDLGATPSISGTSGNHTIVFTVVPMSMLRLKYTSSAGTGSLTATIKGKGW